MKKCKNSNIENNLLSFEASQVSKSCVKPGTQKDENIFVDLVSLEPRIQNNGILFLNKYRRLDRHYQTTKGSKSRVHNLGLKSWKCSTARAAQS